MISKQMKNGNKSERDVGWLFQANGFWAHNFAKSQSGSQPVDLVAIRGNDCWLVDVKHVREEESSFPFSRIEPNQLTCFDYARNFAKIQNLGFVICFERFDLKPLLLTYDKYLEMDKKGLKSVKMSDLEALEEYL